MNRPGPVDFFVDLPQLERLGSELRTLVSALSELDGWEVPADAHSMGGEDVAGAVHRFVDRWRGGRHEVTRHLSACLEIVDLAIAGYGTTENDLTCAVLPAGASIVGGARP